MQVKHFRTLIVLAATLLLGKNIWAQDAEFLKKLSDEILVNGQAYDHLRVLTKTIGGRLSGSPQMVKAENWGYKALQVSGADTVYMQTCMVPHWIRGGKDKATLQMPSAKGNAFRYLDVVALGNSIGSGSKGIKAPVIMVRNYEELERMKDSVRGKIVFYNYAFDQRFVQTFQAYRDAGKYRTGGPSMAAKYGAVGTLVRSMSGGTDNNPHTGATRYDSAYTRIPAAAIGLQDADFLATFLQSQSNATVLLQTNGQFLPDTIGHNVIAELRGSLYPDSIITVGGHLDSWDNCEGAHDDGAGCVQTIEILRAFKALGYQPKHTIRFVLFANEENGLRGGNAYADAAVAKGEKHLMAMESDAGGFTPRTMGFSGSDAQWQKVQTWQPLFAFLGTQLQTGGSGADIGPLNRSLKTPMASLGPDSQRYFDIHHARSDVFESVNKRELLLGAVNMAAFIYLADQHGL